MLDELHINDIQIEAKDIRQLESADQLAMFFANLHYNIDVRTPIPLEATPYASSQDLRLKIKHHELLATDPVDEDIRIYLFEVRSITAKLRNDLARGFRKTNDEKVLLVLTVDYETLEFVYLERTSPQKTKQVGTFLTLAIRPIPLLIKRRNPDSVAVRALKRLSFTEEDADYQWSKLRSAFAVAEWSEKYFNNRALFSDYYLKERLVDPQITPEWEEDAFPVGRKLFKLYTNAAQKYSRQPKSSIRKGLYEPIFDLLGFHAKPMKASHSAAEEADYLLYGSPEQPDSPPIAAVLTYVWNRNLDDVDESRELGQDQGGTPFDVPGARVVSLLENQQTPWVIVTNGKLWRLYSATASNKATNYYEVDLEEAFNADEQLIALKYWWLLFRPQAFTGFLEQLLKNSAAYAKELGDRLKDRVFVEIFPQFAKGFIADMRAQGRAEETLDLEQVFNATMTFLYRLMFILYAESLDLLPMQDGNGYRGHSLSFLKEQIAKSAGTLSEASPLELEKKYSTDQYQLYAHLQRLFSVIDQGSDELNIPTYNGGLFSAETDSGLFLSQYRIPDRYLALGLDRLCRDVDNKTQALVFIDFKSLGVRQLGSIYEGLLEFKLKIATEPLAVSREKGRERYVPAANVKKPLAILAPGDVYLENDKQERKATGSYYTPDYIVKYIVQHTVGPVLDRKFEALEPRLHAAQRGFRLNLKQVEAKQRDHKENEPPDKYWNNKEMQALRDECLNMRVLDPAMGSGHFLVEVVDYISNRLIDFLNGWSENPVWNLIDKTRQDILEEMTQQKVTINADRLTRVALLKRAVLKRCIYGVDLNGMAVELAKVSLWLDAFTLGAPLSFLDHHLKHGNSLIGARIADVQEALGQQQTLFSTNKFAGVMLATDLMRQVSYLSDNTVEQSRQSAQAYRDARDHLAPYKRMLDVYTSRWFGNAPRKGKKGRATFDPAIEFLRRDDTQGWLENPDDPAHQFAADDYMKAAEIAATALQAAAEKRFFHWELEFPEIFFAPSKSGGQDIQLNPNGGFDAVVGNPPYGSINDQGVRTYLEQSFSSQEYQYDLFVFFAENGLKLLATKGMCSNIVPSTFLGQHYYSKIRKYLLDNSTIHRILHFKYPVFEDATVESTIYLSSRESCPNDHSIEMAFVHSEQEIKGNLIQYGKAHQSLFQSMPGYDLNTMIVGERAKIFTKLLGNNNDSFSSVAEITVGIKPYQTGKGIPKQTKETVEKRVFDSNFKKDNTYQKYLVGSDISRYELRPANRWISYGAWLAEPRYSAPFNISEKILIRQTGDSIIASLDTSQHLTLNNLHNVILKQSLYSYKYVLCLLNSSLINFFHRTNVPEEGRVFAEVKTVDLALLPIRRIVNTTHIHEREQITNQIIAAYELGDNAGVVKRVRAVLEAGQTDVVHDVLAQLAQRMIDLNQAKQAETSRFLGWLEQTLAIVPKNDGTTGINSLTGKTILQGYLGDYQKGEKETSWADFHYRLYQNRNRFAVPLASVEGEIGQAYASSLATLRPIKQELARTDALIDKIVYRLYGLTDAEIELIERPQYKQALSDAKSQVIHDKTIEDDEAKIEKIAENILPVAQRFFERVEVPTDEMVLDADLPHWRALPPDAPTFLLTGDYNLRSLPAHMDFSSSIIPYTKAVEVALHQLIFEPFRQNHSEQETHNSFMQGFMRGDRHLTLGNYMIILSSHKEKALRQFASQFWADIDGVTAVFNNQQIREIRNKAAHDDVLSREEAQQTRSWALGLLAALQIGT